MNKQNKQKIKNKSVVLGIIVILGVMVTLMGLTYAYFRTKIVENSEMESINNPSKLLKVIYEDDDRKVVTDPLYGPGRTVKKEFQVRNVGDDTGNYSIILDNIENTLERTWDIRYTLKNKTTEEVLVKGTLGKELKRQMVYADISIDVNTTDEYVFELEYENPDEDQSIDMGKQISFKIDIIEAHENIFKGLAKENTLLYAIGRDNKIVNPETIPGKQISSENEAELSYTEDDDGTSYYFRGNVQNNYVTMGDTCWRIVRVLGNGDIKLVLASEKGECKAENLTDTSALINEGTYFGYGVESNIKYEGSTLEAKLNEWYQQKLALNLNNETILKAEWCNDTSVGSIDGEMLYYGARERLTPVTNAHPSLSCKFLVPNELKTEEIKNRFGQDVESIIVETEVATLSADEVAFAGLYFGGVASNSYLIQNAKKSWWTISPWGRWALSTGTLRSYGYYVSSVLYGGSESRFIYGGGTARPAIVLNSNVIINDDNDGTLEKPYIISN